MDNEFIDKVEAAHLTGKSVRTIERWMSANSCHVTPSGLIKADELRKTHGFLVRPDDDKSRDIQIKGMELANTQISLANADKALDALERQMSDMGERHEREIDRYEKQLETKDETIKYLINNKSKLPQWLVVGFIALILCLLSVFYIYTSQQSIDHQNELAGATAALRQKIYAKDTLLTEKDAMIQEKDKTSIAQDEKISHLESQIEALKANKRWVVTGYSKPIQH